MEKPQKRIYISESKCIATLADALEFQKEMIEAYGDLAEDTENFFFQEGYAYDEDVTAIKFAASINNENYKKEMEEYEKFLLKQKEDEFDIQYKIITNEINNFLHKKYLVTLKIDRLISAIKNGKSIPNAEQQVNDFNKTITRINSEIKRLEIKRDSFKKENQSNKKTVDQLLEELKKLKA